MREREEVRKFFKNDSSFFIWCSLYIQIFPYSKKKKLDFILRNSPLVNLAIKIKGGTLALVERERERERENK